MISPVVGCAEKEGNWVTTPGGGFVKTGGGGVGRIGMGGKEGPLVDTDWFVEIVWLAVDDDCARPFHVKNNAAKENKKRQRSEVLFPAHNCVLPTVFMDYYIACPKSRLHSTFYSGNGKQKINIFEKYVFV